MGRAAPRQRGALAGGAEADSRRVIFRGDTAKERDTLFARTRHSPSCVCAAPGVGCSSGFFPASLRFSHIHFFSFVFPVYFSAPAWERQGAALFFSLRNSRVVASR